jgi:hypothetical protein
MYNSRTTHTKLWHPSTHLDCIPPHLPSLSLHFLFYVLVHHSNLRDEDPRRVVNKPSAMYSKISTPEMNSLLRVRQRFKPASLVITYLFLFT